MTESQRNNEARIMTFYSGWIEIQGNKEKEDAFLQKYLDYSPESLEILSQGKQEDVVDAIKVLLSIPIPQFIDAINHTYMLLSKDVFQYSKLEDATDTICTILEFEEHRLSYEEAGKRLTHSRQQNACSLTLPASVHACALLPQYATASAWNCSPSFPPTCANSVWIDLRAG